MKALAAAWVGVLLLGVSGEALAQTCPPGTWRSLDEGRCLDAQGRDPRRRPPPPPTVRWSHATSLALSLVIGESGGGGHGGEGGYVANPVRYFHFGGYVEHDTWAQVGSRLMLGGRAGFQGWLYAFSARANLQVGIRLGSTVIGAGPLVVTMADYSRQGEWGVRVGGRLSVGSQPGLSGGWWLVDVEAAPWGGDRNSAPETGWLLLGISAGESIAFGRIGLVVMADGGGFQLSGGLRF